MGKSAKPSKLDILNHFHNANHFGPLWCKMIGKSAKLSKLGILNHFKPLGWEKIGKMQNGQDWLLQVISDLFSRRKLEKEWNN